ncbi:MAG TPA: heparinase II/III family protein [Kiritimatiellia bacterium]|nr:heparinase II/III family protein [Kiritimatiellia bacterium]HRU69649.1 heparinase II/III family protein [Kiritimatiellia bacterium]
MTNWTLGVALLAVCSAAAALSDAVLSITVAAEAIPNAGFEDTEALAWTIADAGMSVITKEAARTGERGLRVTDTSGSQGSSCRSVAVPVTVGKTYALSFWGRVWENDGAVGVYLQFANAKGQVLTSPSRHGEIIQTIQGDKGEWRAFTVYGEAPPESTVMWVWVHSFNGSCGMADVDDFAVTEVSAAEARRARIAALRTSKNGFPPPDESRVAQIAAWLAPAPHGLGRPATDREAWDRLATLPEAGPILRDAEKAMKTPPPELPDELYLEFTTNGNRRNYERPYGQRTQRITSLLLAECLEDKGRFLPALERDLLAVCDERSWTMPAHDGSLSNFKGTRLTIDLGSSARGWLLSEVDAWLGHRLSPEVRERLRSEVRRRVLGPYLNVIRDGNINGNWWMRCNNNWNAVCSAGVVGCALALLESREERALVLAAVEFSNPFFISGFTDDGYCSEGMGYWNYGFGHYVMMGLAVRAATGGQLDLFTCDKLPRIAAYAKGYQIQPGRAPWFADGGGAPSHEIWALVRQVYPAAVPADMPVPPLLKGGHAIIGLRAFGQEPPPAVDAKESLPIRTYFQDAQVLITRSGGTTHDVPFGAAIKGGHNAEHHNHNDVGSYAIVLDGMEMLGDPGGEIYTRRTFSRERYVSQMLNSYGHPVPVVAGQLQTTGRHAAARVLEATFSDTRDLFRIDYAAAYRVPDLTTLTRTFTHDRTARVMTISDEVRFTTAQTFSVPIITYREVTRIDGTTLHLHDKQRCVEVKIIAEGGEWRLEEEWIVNPGKASPRRLAVTFAAPVTSARVGITVTPLAVKR